MTTRDKMLWTIAAIALVGCFLTARGGIVNVHVVERQPEVHNIHVIVPGILVTMTLHLVPARCFHNSSSDLQQWLPVVRAVSDSLSKMPDTVLVEVTDPQEHVLVRKSGGSLITDVNDANENVHVSVPVRMLRDTAEIVAAKQTRN
jgi:hypothetical protein